MSNLSGDPRNTSLNDPVNNPKVIPLFADRNIDMGRLRMEAAEWVVRIHDRDATEADYVRWQAWLAADPSNHSLYEECEQAWFACTGVSRIPRPTSEELHADEYTGTENISTWLQRSKDRRGNAGRWTAYAAALTALTIGGITAWALLHSRPMVLETTVAEQRSVRLEDGSRIELSGESRVRVSMGSAVRSLSLDRGEAYFEVAPDPQRPFIVSVDGHEVRAVGTAFDVEKTSDRVVVTVSHGIVQVTKGQGASGVNVPTSSTATPALQLRAGEQAAVDRQGIRRLSAKSTVVRAAPWREGRLEYMHEQLRYVVDDVNRYVERKIVIDDPEIARMQFTGTVFLDHLDEWLITLPGTFPVWVNDAGSQRILARRP